MNSCILVVIFSSFINELLICHENFLEGKMGRELIRENATYRSRLSSFLRYRIETIVNGLNDRGRTETDHLLIFYYKFRKMSISGLRKSKKAYVDLAHTAINLSMMSY